jgi:hypothetical protein
LFIASEGQTREKKKWSPVRREKNKTKRKILLCYLLPLRIPIPSPNVSLCIVASPSVHIHMLQPALVCLLLLCCLAAWDPCSHLIKPTPIAKSMKPGTITYMFSVKIVTNTCIRPGKKISSHIQVFMSSLDFLGAGAPVEVVV